MALAITALLAVALRVGAGATLGTIAGALWPGACAVAAALCALSAAVTIGARPIAAMLGAITAAAIAAALLTTLRPTAGLRAITLRTIATLRAAATLPVAGTLRGVITLAALAAASASRDDSDRLVRRPGCGLIARNLRDGADSPAVRRSFPGIDFDRP